ncbi:MAG: PAS domain S-box protein [Planctomycetota bacterium]|jgi:PAS domain S-box-containing protein
MSSSKEQHRKSGAKDRQPGSTGGENETAELLFQQHLRDLIEVGNLLSKGNSFDELCRRAVELGLERLGFERLGLWFFTDDPRVAKGSFGTDEQGHVRDERDLVETGIDERMVDSVIRKQKTFWRHKGTIPNINHEPLGQGVQVAATIWDGQEVIGYINADNLIHHRPITEYDCELLELYASTLGHLCSRQRIQQALAEERNLLRNLIDNLPGHIYVKDNKSRFVVANRGTVRSLGRETLDEVVGKTDADFFPTQDHAKEYLAEEQAVLRTGQPMIEKEVCAVGEEGDRLWISINKMPWRDSHGKIVGLIGMNFDITNLKRAQEQLREREEQLRLTLNQAPIGIMAYDMDCRFQKVNPAYCRIVGYEEDELLKMSVMDITARDDIGLTAEHARNLWEGQIPYGQYEKRYIRKDGLLVDVNVHVGLVRNIDGDPVYLVAHVEDITKRKRAERALKVSEERFRSLVETTSDWIWEVDRDGSYIYASPAIGDILGYGPDEVIGKTPFDLMPADEAKRIADEFKSIAEARRPFKGLVNTNLHKNGQRIDLETSGVPIFDVDGEFRGYRGIDRDITERRNAEEALLKREEAERKMRGQLTSLLDMSVHLSTLESFDDFCREAVEQARKQLGFDRAGIWFYSKQQPDTVVGTYGTDDEGRTRDERDIRLPLDEAEKELLSFHNSPILNDPDNVKTLLHRRELDNDRLCEVKVRRYATTEIAHAVLIIDKPFYDRSDRHTGDGTLVRACICDGDQVVGHISVDNKLTLRPFTEYDYELFAMLASTLSHLYTRRRAEEALRESERTLKAITDSAMDAIVMMDHEGKVAFWNPAAEKIFGYTAEEVTGEDLHITLAPENYHEDYRVGFKRFAELGEGKVLGRTLELVGKRKDGTEFPVELSVSHALQIEGKQYVAGVIRDITERKRAEKDLQQAHDELEMRVRERTAALTASNQRLMAEVAERKRAEEALRLTQFSIDHTAEAAFWIGPDARILYVNEAACRYLGYSREELLSMTVHDLDPDFTPDAWPGHWEELKNRGSFTMESHHRAKDGKLFPVEITINYMEYNGREYNFAFARDITERKQLQNQLLQSQKLESVGTLAGGIAHDFNNLLAVIMGQVSVRLRDDTLPEKIHESLVDIMDAAERGSSLTNQLLAYARGGLQRPVAVNLNEIIQSVLLMLRRTSPPQIELLTELADDLPAVIVDPTQIEQVVMNLCLNAIQASKPPSTIKVGTAVDTLSAKRAKLLELDKGSYVCLQVKDQGCGMDSETVERIFEPFFSTKNMGRGMGLPAALGIVQSHNGRIQVESTPGGGTTISVWLPKAKAEAVVHPARPTIEWEEPPQGSETILVIDDDRAVARTVEQMLSMLGYIVVAHTDADEATAFMETNFEDIDLVLMNLNMPKCSSEEMLSRIIQRCPHAPVLLASGFDDQEGFNKLIQKGAVGFVHKPFSVMILAKALRKALDEAKNSSRHSDN